MTTPAGPAPTLDETALKERYGAYLAGEKNPETAEELMRARYAAYALHDIEFILRTHHPDKREDTDRDGTERWSRESVWLGLEIVATSDGGPDDNAGVVEFLARYKLKGVIFAHRERAEFRKQDGVWYFWEGQQIAGPPVKKATEVGRNDICPCGSGKKYKKCCGRNA